MCNSNAITIKFWLKVNSWSEIPEKYSHLSFFINMINDMDLTNKLILAFANYHLIMFAMAKLMEMTKEEQNQVALYLFNNIKIL